MKSKFSYFRDGFVDGLYVRRRSQISNIQLSRAKRHPLYVQHTAGDVLDEDRLRVAFGGDCAAELKLLAHGALRRGEATKGVMYLRAILSARGQFSTLPGIDHFQHTRDMRNRSTFTPQQEEQIRRLLDTVNAESEARKRRAELKAVS